MILIINRFFNCFSLKLIVIVPTINLMLVLTNLQNWMAQESKFRIMTQQLGIPIFSSRFNSLDFGSSQPIKVVFIIPGGFFFCNTINVIFYSLTFSVIRLTINSPRKVVVWILKSNMRSIITISFLRRLLHRIWFGMQIVTYTVANPYIL